VTKRSNRKKYLLRVLFVCAVCTPFILTKISQAGFSKHELKTHVEIDGVDYGTFDFVTDLEPLALVETRDTFQKVTLKRDFVTDPSLYLWAKNMMRSRSDLKSIHIVKENLDGEEVSRYVLKFVQPLSWTVEAANPALGGFHEKIDLAVQEISHL
jgi:hypothetical protein